MKYSTVRVALLCSLLGGSVLCSVGSARGDVIFDNFPNPTQGFGAVTANFWQAQKFNSDASNLLLTSANLTLFSGGGSGSFFLRLYSDAAGQPGASLTTLFSGPDPFSGPFPQTGNIEFGGLNQPLAPNTNYWLVLGVNSGPALDLRWGATSFLTGTGSGFQTFNASTSNQGAGWSVSSSSPNKLQLIAIPIPEPASMLLGLLGSGGMLLVRRSRRR